MQNFKNEIQSSGLVKLENAIFPALKEIEKLPCGVPALAGQFQSIASNV